MTATTSRPHDERPPTARPLTTPWLVASVGLAPTAWLVHIAALPALVPLACETGATWPLHLTTVVLAAVAAVGVVLAHRARAAVEAGQGDAYLSERARQWARWGVLVSWGFLALTLAEHVPVLVLSPCPP